MHSNIISLTDKSTHLYLVEIEAGYCLVDAGWPERLQAVVGLLKGYQIELNQIRYVMFTHAHPDHAGLVQPVKTRGGARLIIHEKQIPALDELAARFAKMGGFAPIRVESGDVIVGADNRAALHALGIPGEIIETPGHSPDSVSLLLDSGAAFTGDLHLPGTSAPEQNAEAIANWQRLLARGAQVFYPGHGEAFMAERVKEMMRNA